MTAEEVAEFEQPIKDKYEKKVRLTIQVRDFGMMELLLLRIREKF